MKMGKLDFLNETYSNTKQDVGKYLNYSLEEIEEAWIRGEIDTKDRIILELLMYIQEIKEKPNEI